MQTIIFNSQKGGSGKTNLCAHLAVEAERSGDGPVYLIDTDPQGTLTTWHETRTAELPQRIETTLEGLPSALIELEKRGAAYCFIDTAPNRTDESKTLFALANLVVVPIRPSPSDLWAVAATVTLLKRVGTPFLFVVTQAKTNANITAQAIAALSHHGPVAQTIVADRVTFSAAMTDGRTAQELAAKSPAAGEITGLWASIQACMHVSMKSVRKVKAHA